MIELDLEIVLTGIIGIAGVGIIGSAFVHIIEIYDPNRQKNIKASKRKNKIKNR